MPFVIICHTPNDVTLTFAVCYIIAIQKADSISGPGCHLSSETHTSNKGRKEVWVFLIKGVTKISDTDICYYPSSHCAFTNVRIKFKKKSTRLLVWSNSAKNYEYFLLMNFPS